MIVDKFGNLKFEFLNKYNKSFNGIVGEAFGLTKIISILILKMKSVIKNIILILALFFFWIWTQAYIGPAIAVGSLAIVVLIIISVLFALIVIFYIPIKKIYINSKRRMVKINIYKHNNIENY